MNGIDNISDVDRIGLTLFVAIALHAVIILGVGFTFEKSKQQQPPDRTLEIMVVQNPIKVEKSKDADFLAQTNQQGGGNEKEKVHPTTKQISPPSPRAAKRQEQENRPVSPPEPPSTRHKFDPVLTSQQPAQKKVLNRPEKTNETKRIQLNAAQLLASSDREIARLSAELDKKTQVYSKLPRHKRITASTQEYSYANYLDAWRRKVERIGNLNYPEEARRRKLYGNLVMHVALRPDGSIKEINIRQTSGHKLLDDAAIRIVRLAAPFAPFPEEIRKETDILDIIRTWQFLNTNRLFAK